jgi:hypothetical protein
MKKIFRLIILAAVALSLHSCRFTSSHTVVKLEPGFTVDTQLVSKLVHNAALQLTYRLPAHWQEHTTFSLIDIRNEPISQYKNLRRNYRQLLNSDHRWKKIVRSDFTKDGFYVHQYMMANENTVNCRLIFFRDMQPFTQLDFEAPAGNAFNSQTKILESVVGSLTATNRHSFADGVTAALLRKQ